MKSQNRTVGRLAENMALNFLLSKNFQLLTSNFQTKFGEIDLIMQDGQVTVFVEVKAKIGLGFGPPEDMFTKSKYSRVKRMSTTFLNGREAPCRIDVVAIILNPDLTLLSLHHYPNVYYL